MQCERLQTSSSRQRLSRTQLLRRRRKAVRSNPRVDPLRSQRYLQIIAGGVRIRILHDRRVECSGNFKRTHTNWSSELPEAPICYADQKRGDAHEDCRASEPTAMGRIDSSRRRAGDHRMLMYLTGHKCQVRRDNVWLLAGEVIGVVGCSHDDSPWNCGRSGIGGPESQLVGHKDHICHRIIKDNVRASNIRRIVGSEILAGDWVRVSQTPSISESPTYRY